MATIANTPTGLIRAFKQGRTAEQKERTEAGKAEGHIFLAPGDIQGEYARTRKLLTTLGGAGRRVITEDDLRQFKAASVKLGKRFGVGITAKDVIDKSLDSRRESAQAQIHYAVPMESRGSLFHFVTNSGPNSKHMRHNVLVDFLEFPSAVAQSVKLTTLARRVVVGRLKFDCDCEDTKYRFRYIATTGGFNAGRPETGFPKLTNGTLRGIACKHTIRVMRSLTTAPVQKRLVVAMEAIRSDAEIKPVKVTKKEAEEIALHQQRQMGRASSKIETTQQAAKRIAGTTASKVRALQAATKEARRRMESQAKKSREALQADFTKILNNAALTPAMRAQLTAMRDASLAEAK